MVNESQIVGLYLHNIVHKNFKEIVPSSSYRLKQAERQVRDNPRLWAIIEGHLIYVRLGVDAIKGLSLKQIQEENKGIVFPIVPENTVTAGMALARVKSYPREWEFIKKKDEKKVEVSENLSTVNEVEEIQEVKATEAVDKAPEEVKENTQEVEAKKTTKKTSTKSKSKSKKKSTETK